MSQVRKRRSIPANENCTYSHCKLNSFKKFAGLVKKPKESTLMALKFPFKLWRLVHDCRTGAIGWNATGDAVVVDYELFEREYLATPRTGLQIYSISSSIRRVSLKPPCFKTSNLSSFIRQMNLYGFQKSTYRFYADEDEVNSDKDDACDLHVPRSRSPVFARKRRSEQRRYGRRRVGHEVHIFSHHLFLRGHAELLEQISRKSSRHVSKSAPRSVLKELSANGRGNIEKAEPNWREIGSKSKFRSSGCQLDGCHRLSKPKSKRTQPSSPATLPVDSSGETLPLTSRKIIKCQKALTKILERALLDWNMKHVIENRFKRCETVLAKPMLTTATTDQPYISDSEPIEVIMDGDTERMLDECVQEQADFDLDVFNDEFPIPWDSLYDWQSASMENWDGVGTVCAVGQSSTSSIVDVCDFKTVDSESIGISQHSETASEFLVPTKLEDWIVTPNVGDNFANFDYGRRMHFGSGQTSEHYLKECQQPSNFSYVKRDGIFPSDPILKYKDPLGAYGDEFSSANMVPFSNTTNCTRVFNFEDSALAAASALPPTPPPLSAAAASDDTHRKLIELATLRPDITNEIYVHVGNRDDVNNGSCCCSNIDECSRDQDAAAFEFDYFDKWHDDDDDNDGGGGCGDDGGTCDSSLYLTE